ncbi:MAG TPA: hypothetical protein VJ346_08095 [Bacteroidales bacterium]|nr:hypothetical protein [Bacteroidales bacterium]
MNELSVPIIGMKENDVAEVTVSIKGRKIRYDFRIESFPWEADETLTSTKDPLVISLGRIYRLKQAIESYDKNWELIQIFNPTEGSDHVHVLYRKKQ